MIRKGAPLPDGGAAALLIAMPLALLLALVIASMIGWLVLGLPVTAYDPIKMPAFVWYYRGDGQVVRAMALGLAGGMVLLGGLAYLLLFRPPPLHGAARFASEREICKHLFRAKAGIVLGRKRGRPLVFGGNEHVLVDAPTRTGKGTGIVIPSLLTWQGSTVVLDVKRENFDATAGFRAAHGQKVFLFNPTEREGRTARYNPLAYIDRNDPDDVIIELQKIATMLFIAPDRGEQFWANGARTGFIGVGAWLAQTSSEPLTMGAIYRHLTNGEPRAFFKKELANTKRTLSPACRTALSDFAGGSDNSFADVKKTITNVLGLWLNPLVDAATSTSDFDLRNLRKDHMSIYLGVSPDEMERVAPLYSLFFQQLIDLNVRELPGKDNPIPVLVVLDEFARLGRSSTLASAFSYVAGYGIRLMPVIQSRSQLQGIYGEHVAEEIIANCGVEVAFTPKDRKLSEDLSERFGYRGQDSVTTSRAAHGWSGQTTRSVSEQRRALILPQEMLEFPPDKLILLRGGIPPIIGSKAPYYASRFFMRRVLDPPVVPPLAKPERAVVAAKPEFRNLTVKEAAGHPDHPLDPQDFSSKDAPSQFADLLGLDRAGNESLKLEEANEHD